MARWYWCGVLGELYGGAIETRFARDLPEVAAFVHGDPVEPTTITESNFQAGRLLTLRTRNSSAYKGLYALLMRDGGRDFRTGEPIAAQTIFDDKIDIHHIFPEKWCKTAGIEPGTYNSIINKTAISARTNRKISGRAPSIYLPVMEKDADILTGRMNEILDSHCVDPHSVRNDQFWDFFGARAAALVERIEAVTGKTITRQPELFRFGIVPEIYDEGPQEWDTEVPIEQGGVVRPPAYVKYKPSSVEWLGDVPAHWDVIRLKWTTARVVGGIWGEEPNGVDDLICVRVADFDRERFIVIDAPPTFRAVDSTQRKGRLLRKGDHLIEKSGGGENQLVGCVVLFDHEFVAVCSNFVARISISPSCSPRFWSYAHATLYYRRLNHPAIKQTTGIQNLDIAAYFDTRVGLPPEDEQQAIADFLDRATAKINTLVTKERTLIERLKEKRVALISRTVTPWSAARRRYGLRPRPAPQTQADGHRLAQRRTGALGYMEGHARLLHDRKRYNPQDRQSRLLRWKHSLGDDFRATRVCNRGYHE